MIVVQLTRVTEEEWARAGAADGYVYIIRDVDHARVKVGYSRTPQDRLRALQTGSSGKLEIVGLIAGSERIERALHAELAAFAVRGEWFSETGVQNWLFHRAKRAPIGYCVADLVSRPAVHVWYEWDVSARKHIKHVYNSATDTWERFGDADQGFARPGFDTAITEVEQK